MKLLVVLFLFLAALVVEFDAKPFYTLRNVKTKKMDPEKLKGLNQAIRDLFKQNFDKEEFKKGLIHFVKAFSDKEILEAWYSLPKSERNCIKQAQNIIYAKIFSGQQYTPDEALNCIKTSCPNSTEQIQKLYDLQIQKLKETLNKIRKEVEKLPPTIQDVIKKLYRGLKKIGFERDEAKLRAAFLPFFQQLLEIPEVELKKLAELCPDLATILTGDLRKPVVVIIRKFIKFCKTGDNDAFDQEFFRAVGKLIPFMQEQFEKLVEAIKNAPEQDLPDFVVQGLEEEICEAFNQIYYFQKEEDQQLREEEVVDDSKFGLFNEINLIV
uniref:Uncharacterized protein n=1 Tax=Acrobeloides nanus TaxID=290746 RepID=A0A914E9W4_9BILA